ncbi:MAG TPA: J domain-containing protein [Nocardioidaceae bacterium]|jgi:molecular chaperone DnaJ|nr:J domain-containing protein [Nocardioidaceae bacterium]
MTGRSLDPYDVLGLAPDATQAEVTSAYRSQLRRHHPDTRDHRADPATADAALRRVIAAYLLLRDPERRARYQRSGRAPGVPGRVVRPAPPADPGPVVHRTAGTQPEPPLRAGPVRWHRGPG